MQHQHPSDGIAAAAVAAVLGSNRRPSQRYTARRPRAFIAGSRAADEQVPPTEQPGVLSGQLAMKPNDLFGLASPQYVRTVS